MVFDRVVEQSCANHIGVGEAVMGHYPERHPQEVVDIRFALSAVVGVEPSGKVERPGDLLPDGGGKAFGFGGEPRSQTCLAVGGGDRVQGSGGDQSPFCRAQPAVRHRPLPRSRCPVGQRLAAVGVARPFWCPIPSIHLLLSVSQRQPFSPCPQPTRSCIILTV